MKHLHSCCCSQFQGLNSYSWSLFFHPFQVSFSLGQYFCQFELPAEGGDSIIYLLGMRSYLCLDVVVVMGNAHYINVVVLSGALKNMLSDLQHWHVAACEMTIGSCNKCPFAVKWVPWSEAMSCTSDVHNSDTPSTQSVVLFEALWARKADPIPENCYPFPEGKGSI